MLNPILKAIQDCKFHIPLQLLQSTFAPTTVLGRPTALNMDALIRDKVIDARCRVDCNLTGGTMLDIPLRNIRPMQVPLPSGTPYSWSLIYEIPMSLTQNRVITRVMWIANTISPISGTYTYASYNGSALTNAAMGVMQSQAPIPTSSTARVDIINTNTIMISDTNQWPYDCTMRVYVEYDNEMSQLPSGSYRFFSKLCLYAIKAYIYNTLIINVNQGELFLGQELGKYKEILDTYADANDLYDAYLEDTMREVLAYSDPNTARDFARLPIGAGV
jgi:hypothetical protein